MDLLGRSESCFLSANPQCYFFNFPFAVLPMVNFWFFAKNYLYHTVFKFVLVCLLCALGALCG